MFSSLRSRLWISYAVVIAVVLAVVGAALFIYLARNPPALRAARFDVEVAAQQLHNRRLPIDQPVRLARILEEFIGTRELRVILHSADGEEILDTAAEEYIKLTDIQVVPQRGEGFLVSDFEDADGQRWLYAGFVGPNNASVIVALPRPSTALISVLADNLFQPLIQVGVLALLLSLLLAILITRWVASPLQRIAEATRAVAVGDLKPIRLEGPREVKQLARAFNVMTKQVHASQQSQRDFVANVSHELKTPLTSIQGFAQAIVDGTADTRDAREHAGQVIFDEAARMDRMVVDLLDLAKLDAGIATLERTPLYLGDLLNAVVVKFKPQSEAAKVVLRAEIGKLPSFIGDGDRLAQVFTNLVDNALKQTPPGGEVILRAAHKGEKVFISVEDSGVGMPEEELSRIFERFYQLDKSRRGGAGRGVGLGLAITHEIVLAHGGTMQAESKPGKGSKITVVLPVAQPDDPTFAVSRSEFKKART